MGEGREEAKEADTEEIVAIEETTEEVVVVEEEGKHWLIGNKIIIKKSILSPVISKPCQ